MKDQELIPFLVGVVFGALIAHALTFYIFRASYQRQSLQGYRAVATYQTNNIGEITIEKIYWKK